jgi:hypothetical protein
MGRDKFCPDLSGLDEREDGFLLPPSPRLRSDRFAGMTDVGRNEIVKVEIASLPPSLAPSLKLRSDRKATEDRLPAMTKWSGKDKETGYVA